MDTGQAIAAVVERMQASLADLDAAGDQRRFFHATYLRTTVAVQKALRDGLFLDVAWVEAWDVAFADLYLRALDAALHGSEPSEPWAVAFEASAAAPDLPPLRHVLLGMNAHINADLPQALLAVIGTADFDDPPTVARRAADHRRIDDVLASRVAAEGAHLSAATGRPSTLDRLLEPLNRRASRLFLRESREKVWANAVVLDAARREGPDAYAAALRRLEALSAKKVRELVAPGQVLLRLAVRGFGVRLPATSGRRVGAPRTSPSRLRTFDPVALGRLECDAWTAYYRRDWVRALWAFLRLVRAGFGFGPLRTLRGAWQVLRGNRLWAPYPDNDPAGARRAMERFYRLVGGAHGEPARPAVCAELEVGWWRAHREAQREGAAQEPVVAAVTALYAEVYAVPAADVRAAAQHRADAMVLSDEWVRQGCARDDPLLDLERAALVRSYAALLAAVHR